MAMVRIHLPVQHSFFKTLYRPVDAYLSFFSIYQDWLMFAPNPARTSYHLTAQVEFDDGSTDSYSFPKTSDLTFAQRYSYGERYRKIISEAIRKDSHKWMWPDTARFALRKLKERNFSKVPMRVHLYRHWYETPDWNARFVPHRTKSPKYSNYKFYTYKVI